MIDVLIDAKGREKHSTQLLGGWGWQQDEGCPYAHFHNDKLNFDRKTTLYSILTRN